MKKYRVKESNGMFVPQKREWFMFFSIWHGIDRNTDYLWTVYQNEKCGFNTIEEAKERIEKYKPKYHY